MNLFNLKNSLDRRRFLQSVFATAALSAAVPETLLHAESQEGAVVAERARKPSVDYVDPNIGGIGHLLTSVRPEVQLPHGMIVVAPWFAFDVTDVYLATQIYGFAFSNSVLLPFSGNKGDAPEKIFSEWDPDRATVTPYYSSYELESFGIRVEYTVAERSACFRIYRNADAPLRVLIRPQQTANYMLDESRTISGTEQNAGVTSYLCVEFSRPTASHQELTFPVYADGHDLSTSALMLDFGSGSEVLEGRVAFSYISAEQARRTLREQVAKKPFASVRSAARAGWSSALSSVHVEGGTEEQRTIFYTALYRSLQYMKNVTEDGRYFGPFDKKVHDADLRDFYIEDNLWDTYRARHPLSILIEPRRHEDMLNSYVGLYQESGWMPQFPFMNGDLLFMSGNHAASMVLDAYAKGQRNFDLALAYEGIRKDAMQATMLPYRRGGLTDLDRFYEKNGYFPALRPGEKETESRVDPDMRRQAVSVTLDAAYDDWCLSEIAKILGKTDDAAYFGRRALNYRNVFDAKTGFMSPRDASGEFIPNFDPKWSGGQAGRDYFTECNGWVYTFDVQHDIAGLIDLMGGRERFVARLDSLFAEGYNGKFKFEFLAQFPDSTALIGQYPQGNEPGHHIPYLYSYAGAPWKTQKCVRRIMQTWYAARPLGLPGDDDNGAMSSWYVFSAMGFYPVCPGRPVYTLGSPLFTKTVIDVGNGKVFTLIANGASTANKYIQSARLNGQALNKTWFEHADVLKGGTLALEMGPVPNKSWGMAEEAAPPSLSPQGLKPM